MQSTQLPLTFQIAAQLPTGGAPDPRLARLAERRAFVELKHSFMRAAADVPGRQGLELQRQVRQSREAGELRRLRRSLFAALPEHGPVAAIHRTEVQYQLDHFADIVAGGVCWPPQ